jgi:AcrR family transcriptional regulator
MPFDTQERLLDAAEKLFAEGGINETSLRAITTEAGANIAAVNYHFGSKEELVKAVFSRRLGPINQQRLELLATVQQRAAPQLPQIEEIIVAFLAPTVRIRANPAYSGTHFMRLMGRLFFESSHLKKIINEQYEEVQQQFFGAFQRVLPNLSATDFFWRFHFMVGVMAHTAAAGELLELISAGHCDQSDAEAILRQMTAFVSAGFKADPSIVTPGEL